MNFCASINCENPIENRDTGLCASCSKKVRKELENAEKDQEKRLQMIAKRAQFKPKQPIKKVSQKMRVKNNEYSTRVKAWKAENPKCKAMVSPDCTGETRDCHHMKKRGDLLMVEKYWLPVCGYCHDWIGRNSDEARQRGLTINHLEPEFVEPHRI